jgi:hypothetical protein
MTQDKLIVILIDFLFIIIITILAIQQNRKSSKIYSGDSLIHYNIGLLVFYLFVVMIVLFALIIYLAVY